MDGQAKIADGFWLGLKACDERHSSDFRTKRM